VILEENYMPDLQGLIEMIERCEADTRELLGPLAAQRLGNWRHHVESENSLVTYNQQLIWGERRDNGRRLDEQNRLSLERIVLSRPDLFGDSDREQAKRTLQI
jgi:hypothetical protein